MWSRLDPGGSRLTFNEVAKFLTQIFCHLTTISILQTTYISSHCKFNKFISVSFSIPACAQFANIVCWLEVPVFKHILSPLLVRSYDFLGLLTPYGFFKRPCFDVGLPLRSSIYQRKHEDLCSCCVSPRRRSQVWAAKPSCTSPLSCFAFLIRFISLVVVFSLCWPAHSSIN